MAGQVLAIMAAIVVVVSCAPQAPDELGQRAELGEPAGIRQDGRVVVGINGEPDGFLPTINRWTPSSLLVARTIYEPLTAFDERGGIHPYLADLITPDASYRRWTITLRTGIRFHDDTPLNSGAVQSHLEAVMSSAVTGSGLSYISRITKVDDLNLTVEMRAPWTEFPAILATQIGFVAAPSLYRGDNAGAPSHPIGTGPFRFASWQPNAAIRVVRNQSYWRRDPDGRALPYLSGVEFRPVADEKVRLQQLEAGAVDIIQSESYAAVSELEHRAHEDPNGALRALLDDTETTESSVIFNTQTGPFADRNLRLAAAHAVDRQGLIDDLYHGFYAVANGPYSDQSYWGETHSYPAYSPALARQLVSEWTAAHGQSPVIRMTNIIDADSSAFALKVEQAWIGAGFRVQLQDQEEKVGTVQLVTGAVDAVLLRFWDRQEPDSLYQFLVSDTIAPPGALSLNFARYRSAAVDDALKSARQTPDRSARRLQYLRVWNDFADNVPILFLFHVRWAAGYRSHVRGLSEPLLPDGSRAEVLNWGTFDLSQVWVQ